MKPITRQYYAEKIDAWIGKGQIIVLTGQRRVGKSYILKDFIERHNSDANVNFIYIDKERKAFDEIKNNEILNNDPEILKSRESFKRLRKKGIIK